MDCETLPRTLVHGIRPPRMSNELNPLYHRGVIRHPFHCSSIGLIECYTQNMSQSEAKVLKEAMALPPKRRARIAVSLLESLDDEVDMDVEEAWKEEVARRVQDLKSGAVTAVSWDEARTAIFD